MRYFPTVQAYLDVLSSLVDDPNFRPKIEVVSRLLLTTPIVGDGRAYSNLLYAYGVVACAGWGENVLPPWMIATYVHLEERMHVAYAWRPATNVSHLFPVSA
jgi:hypothetical protein